MSKTNDTPAQLDEDDILPEYDFSKGVRGKHHQAYQQRHSVTIRHQRVSEKGVDERQIANALKLAHTLSTNFGFQYRCTFNSDMIQYSELGDDFDVHSFVRLRLTDDSDDGRLLGINF